MRRVGRAAQHEERVMTITAFPPVEFANDDGLLALGGDLDEESLLLAYRSGIFPWPLNRQVLAWFAPPRRALLFLDRVHVPRSLRKLLRRNPFEVHVDRDFPAVIRACAAPVNRGLQRGTWITPGIIAAYTALHRRGYVHSIESYQDDRLAGGLYGISIGKMFAGESMFYRTANASKIALLFLLDHLRARGAAWMDCQVMTPMIEGMGAVEVERDEFMRLLGKALSEGEKLF